MLEILSILCQFGIFYLALHGHGLSAYSILSGFLIMKNTADFALSGSTRLINGVACYS